MDIANDNDGLWASIQRAVEKAEQRLERIMEALDSTGRPYAVAGGHAVRARVAEVDESALRNCPDVEIVIAEGDLGVTIAASIRRGFVLDPTCGRRLLDGPDGKRRDGVAIFFAEEFPTVFRSVPIASERVRGVRTLPLRDLVGVFLQKNRCVDLMNTCDLIDVGLIDQSWPSKYPEVLAERLQALLDDPDG